MGSRGALDHQPVEEVLKCQAAGVMRRPVGREAGFANPDSQWLSFAANLPGPPLGLAPGPRHDDIERSARRRPQHQPTSSAAVCASRRF